VNAWDAQRKIGRFFAFREGGIDFLLWNGLYLASSQTRAHSAQLGFRLCSLNLLEPIVSDTEVFPLSPWARVVELTLQNLSMQDP
jgi:hypothetical protein